MKKETQLIMAASKGMIDLNLALQAHNDGITQANKYAEEHNRIAPPEQQIAMRPLLTLEEFTELRLREIADQAQREYDAKNSDNATLIEQRDTAYAQANAAQQATIALDAKCIELTVELSAAIKDRDDKTKQVDELIANNAQVVQSLRDEHEQALGQLAIEHQKELDAKIAELAALKESLKPKPPSIIPGEMKSITLTIPAASWALVTQALYDPDKDIPAETQATNFVLDTVAARYAEFAKKTAMKPLEKQVENTKKQVDKVVGDRIVEVLAATSVVVE